jgi:hypothetical protein
MLSNALPDKAEMGWKKNETKMLLTFDNGSMIQFGGSDEPDSLRGIDAIGMLLDERALIKEEVWTAILLPVVMGSLPPHLKDTDAFRWVMNTYTPKGINHATIGFDKACMLESGGILPDCGKAIMMKPGHFASRIDAELTDVMTPQALAIAKDEAPLVIYEQEFRCKRTTQEERTLITSAMLQGLEGIDWGMTRLTYPEKKRIVSIDPAFGGDMCDIKGMENTRVLEHSTQQNHLTNEIVANAKMMAQNIGTKNFIVDCIGIGKGVADMLNADEAGYHVQYFTSSESPTDALDMPKGKKSLFKNKKAQAAYYVAQEIKAGRVEAVSEYNMAEPLKRELLRQIPMATRYKITGSGQIILLPKDEVKKELGCSPDSSDSWIQGVWGLQYVEAVGSERVVKERPGSGVYIPYHIGAA